MTKGQFAETLKADPAFVEMIRGHRLVTAEILYRLPDYPSLLQTFTWQTYDLLPKCPRLCGFLEYWERNLDGKIYSVTVGSRQIIAPPVIEPRQTFYLH